MLLKCKKKYDNSYQVLGMSTWASGMLVEENLDTKFISSRAFSGLNQAKKFVNWIRKIMSSRISI